MKDARTDGARHAPGVGLYRRLRATLLPGVEPGRIDVRRGDHAYERLVEPGPMSGERADGHGPVRPADARSDGTT